MSPNTDKIEQCTSCGAFFDDSRLFCSSCGQERDTVKVESDFHLNKITPYILFYFIYLVVSLVYGYSQWIEDTLTSEIVVTAILVALTLMYCIIDYRGIAILLSFRAFKISALLSIVAISMAGAIVVFYFAEWMNLALFGESDSYYLRYYLLTDYPLIYSILLVCVQPAIFEELAFRGFLFNSLEKASGDRSALIVTSFLFAVLHLSFLALFWLLPLAFLFGYFRMKYKSLWYGIIGHFCYNFTIVILEYIQFNL